MYHSDLPQLESVEYPVLGGRSFRSVALPHTTVVVALAVMVITLLALVLSLLRMKTPSIWIPVACVEFGMSAIFIVMGVGLARAPYYWRTSSEGLYARALTGTQFMRWQDVNSISKTSGTWGERYAVRSGEQLIYFPSDISMLTASVWQHLNRHGKAEGLRRTWDVLVLWHPIPAPAQDEMEWTNPEPPCMRKAVVSGTVIVCLISAFLLAGTMSTGKPIKTISLTLVPALALLFIALNLYTLPLLRTARQVFLLRDRLEIDTVRRRISIPWAEITSAYILTGFDIVNIRVGKNLVSIPLRLDDDGNRRLIAAIVHRLWETLPTPLLQIPEVVHNALSGHASE